MFFGELFRLSRDSLLDRESFAFRNRKKVQRRKVVVERDDSFMSLRIGLGRLPAEGLVVFNLQGLLETQVVVLKEL